MNRDLPLSPDDVAEIAAILDNTPYERIEIRTDRFSLSVSRSGAGWVESWDWVAKTGDIAPLSESEPPKAPRQSENIASTESDITASSDAHHIRAQLPGTFYRSPQPAAAPFVEVGQRIESGAVVGIIETMKLMTSVQSDVSGTVTSILVDNATLVEAGTPLVRVKPGP